MTVHTGASEVAHRVFAALCGLVLVTSWTLAIVFAQLFRPGPSVVVSSRWWLVSVTDNPLGTGVLLSVVFAAAVAICLQTRISWRWGLPWLLLEVVAAFELARSSRPGGRDLIRVSQVQQPLKHPCAVPAALASVGADVWSW